MTPEPSPNPEITSESSTATVPPLELLPPVPRQINLYTGEEELPNFMLDLFPADRQERVLEEGLTVVQSPEGLTVSLSGFGGYVGKKSERLVLKKKDGKVVWQIPFDQLHELLVYLRELLDRELVLIGSDLFLP